MSDQENTGELVEMVSVQVVNTAHDGYRRAGFVLCRGENTLPPVTAAVLKALEADPRLSVMAIAADIDSDAPRGLGDTGVSTTVAFDEMPLAPVTETTKGAEASHTVGDITVHVEGFTGDTILTHRDETAAPVEVTAPVPDTEAAQPETPKKGKGKK